MSEPVTVSVSSRVLYLIVCAAPPAQQTADVMPMLQAEGWNKLPGEADPLPKADAILVMPATFNTINKWAQGIGDTLAASILCEALGRGTPPVVAVPCLKMDLVRHPAFARSIALLRDCGVCVLHEPERYPSPLMVPWSEVIESLHSIAQGPREA